MKFDLRQSLITAPVVPLVQSNNPGEAVKTAGALIEGGLNVIEVVLRTDAALNCLDAIIREFPDAVIGAGTVLTSKQTNKVIQRGAKFIVSPGLDDASVIAAQEAGIPIFPGIATPSELQNARNMGLRMVKFFPAALVGGPPMLRALSSVYHDMEFMPTGGVNAENLTRYLSIRSVIACGGSWLTPAEHIENQEYYEITELARKALELAHNFG